MCRSAPSSSQVLSRRRTILSSVGPNRYGPFVGCFLAPYGERSLLGLASLTRMRRRILLREGRPLSAARPLASRPPRVVVLGYRMTQKDLTQNNSGFNGGIGSISGFNRVAPSCMDSFDPNDPASYRLCGRGRHDVAVNVDCGHNRGGRN